MASVLSGVIEPALQELGVLADGESATQGQAADGLRALNDLLDAWKLERLTAYRTARTEASLSSSVSLDRPVSVDRVALLDTSTDPETETPLRELTDAEYQEVRQKEAEADLPTAWYYDPTYPLGTVYVFPVPSDTTDLSLAIYSVVPLSEYDEVTDALSVPPGYRRAMVKNLAVELAPSYSRQVSPLLMQQAMQAKDAVKLANVRRVKTRFPADVPGVCGPRYDIEAG